MNKFEFALITLRLLAVYLVVQALNSLPLVLSTLWSTWFAAWADEPGSSGMMTYYKLFVILQTVLPLVFGLFLLSFSRPLAEWLVGAESDELARLTIRSVELHAIVLSVTGVVLLFYAMPPLLATAVMVAFSRGVGAYAGPILTPEQVPQLIGQVAQLVLAITLIAGTKFWVSLIYRFRNAGLPDSPEHSSTSLDSPATSGL